MSVDPLVIQTRQPYVFTGDDPLNSEDPLGECGGAAGWICSTFDFIRHSAAAGADFLIHHPWQTIELVGAGASLFLTDGADGEVVADLVVDDVGEDAGTVATKESINLSTKAGQKALQALVKAGDAAGDYQTVQACVTKKVASCVQGVLESGGSKILESNGASKYATAAYNAIAAVLPSPTEVAHAFQMRGQ
jgi:hypothetical protein